MIIIGALASEWEAFVNNLDLLGPAIISLIFLMLFIGYASAMLFNLSKEKIVFILDIKDSYIFYITHQIFSFCTRFCENNKLIFWELP